MMTNHDLNVLNLLVAAVTRLEEKVGDLAVRLAGGDPELRARMDALEERVRTHDSELAEQRGARRLAAFAIPLAVALVVALAVHYLP